VHNVKAGRSKFPTGAKEKIVAMRFETKDLKRTDAAANVGKKSPSEWMRSTLFAAIEA
jgi:hypothetical protein